MSCLLIVRIIWSNVQAQSPAHVSCRSVAAIAAAVQAQSRRTLESSSKLSIYRSYLLFSLSSFSIPPFSISAFIRPR
jgi:hypothetical protein